MRRARDIVPEHEDGYVYHWTSQINLPAIAVEGLVPRPLVDARGRVTYWDDGMTEPRVYFGEFPYTYQRRARSPRVLLRVRRDRLMLAAARRLGIDQPRWRRGMCSPKGRALLGAEVVTREVVPPEQIEVWTAGSWRPLIEVRP